MEKFKVCLKYTRNDLSVKIEDLHLFPSNYPDHRIEKFIEKSKQKLAFVTNHTLAIEKNNLSLTQQRRKQFILVFSQFKRIGLNFSPTLVQRQDEKMVDFVIFNVSNLYARLPLFRKILGEKTHFGALWKKKYDASFLKEYLKTNLQTPWQLEQVFVAPNTSNSFPDYIIEQYERRPFECGVTDRKTRESNKYLSFVDHQNVDDESVEEDNRDENEIELEENREWLTVQLSTFDEEPSKKMVSSDDEEPPLRKRTHLEDEL